MIKLSDGSPFTAATPLAAAPTSATPTTPTKSRKPRPKAPPCDLTVPRRLRVSELMFLYGKGQSAFYTALRDGHIPPPDGRDPRPFWNSNTILAHLHGVTPTFTALDNAGLPLLVEGVKKGGKR